MKKEYYIQAANSVKELAIACSKRQANIEKEAQALFFWILKHFENEIKWADYWERDRSIWCLEILNQKIGKSDSYNDELMYSTDRYRRLFVKSKEFGKAIKRVVDIFNGVEDYNAEYFSSAEYGDTIIRITLTVKNMEEK